MLLLAQQLHKSFTLGGDHIAVLAGLDLSLAAGDFLAVMGKSGSGKSTLLHILGTLARPDAGSYLLGGKDMLALDDTTQSAVRAEWIGFVFQTFNLLPELTVSENVALPFLYQQQPVDEVRERVFQAIERVGLSHRLRHRPQELSGGEMQRVAIARALAIHPLLILADEPTGNLDSSSSADILDLLLQVNSAGSTIVLVTHDRQVAAAARRCMEMRDGRLHE